MPIFISKQLRCSLWANSNAGTAEHQPPSPWGFQICNLRNCMVSRCCILALVCCIRRIPFLLEQPASSLMQFHPDFQCLCRKFEIYRAPYPCKMFEAFSNDHTWRHIVTHIVPYIYIYIYRYIYIAIYVQFSHLAYTYACCISLCFCPQPLPKSKSFEPIPEVFVWLGSYGGSRSLPATSGTSGGLWRSRWIKA